MGILKEATNSIGYMKAGFLGFGGSGKTTTAALLAIGLSKEFGKHKAVAMVDTERGSDFLIPLFKKHGIAFYPVRTRAFADVLTVHKEAEGTCDVVLTDSVTHVWREVCSAYQKKKNRSRLSFRDWAPIKDEWQRFMDAYVNGPYHAIICGRAGFDFDEEVDEETGQKDLVKLGVKMKTEGETGFEPSFLVEMQRVARGAFDPKKPETHGWLNRAIVLKDRAMKMNGEIHDFGGKVGEEPTYEEVLSWVEPHASALNIGGVDAGIQTERNSESLFDDNNNTFYHRKRKVEIVLELITDAFTEAGVGTASKDDKKRMVDELKAAFGTSAWSAIQGMSLEDLEKGHEKLRKALFPIQPTEPVPA